MCSLKCPSLDADRGVVVQGHLREKLSSESSAFIAWDKFKISWEILRRECVFCETGAGVLSKSLIIQVSLIQEQALNTACQSGPFACSLIPYDSCRHEQDLDLFELRAWPWCRWSIDQYRWDMIIHDHTWSAFAWCVVCSLDFLIFICLVCPQQLVCSCSDNSFDHPHLFLSGRW